MGPERLGVSLIPALGLSILISGCHADARVDAARDVRHFLRAAKTGDMAGFEAGLDRTALRHNLLPQIGRALPRKDTAVLAPKLVDALLQPQAFRVQVEGSAANMLPDTATFALSLKWVGPGKVCLPAGPRRPTCTLVFQREGGAWKLVDMRLDAFRATIRRARGGDVAVGSGAAAPAKIEETQADG